MFSSSLDERYSSTALQSDVGGVQFHTCFLYGIFLLLAILLYVEPADLMFLITVEDGYGDAGSYGEVVINKVSRPVVHPFDGELRCGQRPL